MVEIDGILPVNAASIRRNRNAKRSSLACLSCKRAKRKCDISRQDLENDGCTNCHSKGEVCEIRYGEDRRRKRGVIVSSDLLTRLSSLEELLSKQNQTPRVNREEGSVLSTVDLSPRDEPAFQADEEAPSAVIEELQSEPSLLRSNAPTSVSNGQSMELQTQQQQSLSLPIEKPQKDHSMSGDLRRTSVSLGEQSPAGLSVESGDGPATDESSAILEKVISREGRLGGKRNDQLTYFGSTSMYHLSHEPPNHHHGPKENSDLEPQYDSSNEPDPVVNHLLDLFWTWQASYLQVMDRRLFLADKKLFDSEHPRRRYDYFSTSLMYAIMALASMISSDRGIKYQSTKSGGWVGDTYFEKAKILFDREMDRPSITTVQTGLLLASRYGVLGKLSLGWTYSGISVRMAMELGLNHDCRKASQLQSMSMDMEEVRRITFWGCYVQDKLWSAYCGRPSSIMDDNITVNLSGEQQQLNDMQTEPRFIPTAVQQNIILLTIECSNILSELYSQKHAGNQSQLQSCAASIHGDLLKWHRSLPDALSWPNKGGTPSSPHVLIMHMQFYFNILLLHRPFIDLSQAFASLNQLHQSPLDTIGICTLAATNITKLARDYSMFYDIKKIASPAVHFIFVASSIHLINHEISHDESHQILFQGCLSSLFEIAESYPTGQKAFSVLRDLWHQFQRPHSRTSNTRMMRPAQKHIPSQQSPQRSGQPTSYTGFGPQGRGSPLADRQGIDTATGMSTLLPYQDQLCQDNGGSGHFRTLPLQNHQHTGNDKSSTTQHQHQQQQLSMDFGNFDWSVCNSPLDLPPALSEIDVSAFDLSKIGDAHLQPGIDPMMSHQIDFANSNHPADFSLHDQQGGTFGGVGGVGVEPSHVMFSRMYGTTFGLDNYR